MKKLIILLLLISSYISYGQIRGVIETPGIEPFKAKIDQVAFDVHINNMNVSLTDFKLTKSGVISFTTDNKLSAIEIVLICLITIRVPDEYKFIITTNDKTYRLIEREIPNFIRRI